MVSAFSALEDGFVKNTDMVSNRRLQAVILNIRDLCTLPNTSRNMTTLAKELTKTIESTNFDESWFQVLVDTWLKCCLKAGGSWDHRTIPLARALEMIYDLKSHQKGDVSRNAGNVYQVGADMAVFNKDEVEMLRFAQMSYALEKGYLPDINKGRPERSREYVMSCKNLAVAHASNGNLPDALDMLRKALTAHEQRFEQEFSLPYGSEVRYKRDEFEIRYHIYMVEGLMASKGLVKHKEAEESYRKAEELVREPPTDPKTIEGDAGESSTATAAKSTEGKAAKDKIPAWKSFGTKMKKKKTTGGSSTEGLGTVVVNKDTTHPNEKLMREIQLKYARATCILADLENKNFTNDEAREQITQCYEHYKEVKHLATQDVKLSYHHRWIVMCDIQLGLLEARHLDNPTNALDRLSAIKTTKDDRPAYDRDYARADFLYAECLAAVGSTLEVQGRKQASLNVYNRLHHNANPLTISEYKWTDADSLVKYNHLDSLDIYYKQVAGVGEEPTSNEQRRKELAAQYRARLSVGMS